MVKAWRQFPINKVRFYSLNTYGYVSVPLRFLVFFTTFCIENCSPLSKYLNFYWPFQFYIDEIISRPSPLDLSLSLSPVLCFLVRTRLFIHLARTLSILAIVNQQRYNFISMAAHI